MSVGVAKAVKSPKAKKVAKPSHPPYKNMAKAAVKNLKEQGGSSRQAILKYIVANYKVGDEKKANTRLCLALKKGVSSGVLAHSKGSGAAGSFTIAKSGKTVAKKTTKRKSKAKKPAVKKAVTVKKPAVKKASKPKKPKAKKAKKPAAKKSPAKKPAARKSRKARK